MAILGGWPDAPALHGHRVRIEPLRVDHAEKMAPLLDDPGLHVFIGGEPASLPELRDRYRRQVTGRSPDGSQRWLNWIVRRLDDNAAVGTVQATVVVDAGSVTAEVAWVVGTAYQGQGYAQEAAATMVTWLRHQQVTTVIAHVHPDHRSSAAVARAVGLRPTIVEEGKSVGWDDDARTVP